MNIRPEEVSSIIKKEIDNYKKSLEIKTSGTALEVGDGIARIYGLSNVMSAELLEFPHGVMGMALNLEEDILKQFLKLQKKKIKLKKFMKC